MRRQIPSTTALLCFEAAARCENFAQAARELNMSQSALGRQIQGLEAQAGQTLFRRARQRVHLTGAGRMLLADLSPQLDALEAAFGSRWLMPRLAELAREQPRLTVNTITYMSNAEVDPALVDLAIVQGDPPWPGFRADPLMPETLLAVAAPSLMPAPAEDPDRLLEQPALQHRTRMQSWEIWFASLDRPLPARPQGPLFGQYEMLIDAARYGHGVAILPEVLIRRELAEGQLIPAHPHACQTRSGYWLLTPQAKAGTSRIEKTRAWLLAQGQRES